MSCPLLPDRAPAGPAAAAPLQSGAWNTGGAEAYGPALDLYRRQVAPLAPHGPIHQI